MRHCIIVGADVHVKEIVVAAAADREEPGLRSFRNNRVGRRALVSWLSRWSARLEGARVVVVYEASSLGYVLYDEVTAAGLECYLLASSKLARSAKQRKDKADDRDAVMLFEAARAWVLAGNPLPVAWVPGPQVRDDREVTRARQDLSEKLTRAKNQVQGLVKRYGLERPSGTGKRWTKGFWRWLDGLAEGDELGWGARVALCTLLAQLRSLECEAAYLDEQLAVLAAQARHAAAVEAMTKLFKGVGLQVALTLLVELGNLGRFPNRRCVASYVGLVPSRDESGEADDRKGHITHQGSPRLRRALCQAVQHWVRWDPEAKALYQRLVARGGRRAKKIAKVAMMRRLLIRLWHLARRALAAARTAQAASE